MKKAVMVLCVLLPVALALEGRGRGYTGGAASCSGRSALSGVDYRNIAASWQKIDLKGKNTLLFDPVLRGISFTSGHSFPLHRRPLWGVAHVGFDATWFEGDYSRWRRRIDGHRKWMHKIDVGPGLGPALHLSPAGRWGVHLWWRYNPTLSIVTHNFAGDEEGRFEIVAGYASYRSIGLSVSWDVFSVGVESRRGGGKFRGVKIPDITVSSGGIENLLETGIEEALDRQRHRMTGWRVFIGFRF